MYLTVKALGSILSTPPTRTQLRAKGRDLSELSAKEVLYPPPQLWIGTVSTRPSRNTDSSAEGLFPRLPWLLSSQYYSSFPNRTHL